MLDDIAKTVRAQLYERVSSPLSGVFLLSWSLWNYEFFIVIFSGMVTTEKINYIHYSLYFDLWPSIAKGIVFPFITTVILIFIYPIPARYVYEHTRKQQRKLKEIRHKIDDETPLTREEARDIRRSSLDQSLQYEREIAKQVAEIARLKQELARDGSMQNSLINAPKPDQGSQSFAVKPTSSIATKEFEQTRVLLTGNQLMDHLIKDFLQVDKVFNGLKFLVLTDDKHVVLTLMPEGLSGQGKHYEYSYDSSGKKSIYSEADRLKRLIKMDIADTAQSMVPQSTNQ